jgi:hypothetical protein
MLDDGEHNATLDRSGIDRLRGLVLMKTDMRSYTTNDTEFTARLTCQVAMTRPRIQSRYLEIRFFCYRRTVRQLLAEEDKSLSADTSASTRSGDGPDSAGSQPVIWSSSAAN